VTDGDSEIKPGGTISVQLDTYKGFDHVECYLTGRSDGQASTVFGTGIFSQRRSREFRQLESTEFS